jgi:hypothetical protein
MISLKWRYKRDVVILSTYHEVEEEVKACWRKQLYCSLLKSTKEGSEQLKNASRRRQKNLRKGREQNLAHEDFPPSDKMCAPWNRTFFFRGCFVVCDVSCLKVLLFMDWLIEYLLRRYFYFCIFLEKIWTR